jgi:hypothetical protein
MKPSEILRSAAELLEPDGRWCQGDLALNKNGNLADARSAAACQWCMAGALVASGSGNDFSAEDKYLDQAVGTGDYVDWNDSPGRQQVEVVAALRKAADLAEAEGQ